MRPTALLLTTRVDNSEMEELVWSLGYDLVATVFQNRARPDPRFHLGRGKLQDARDVAKALGVDCVIVNEALKPNQLFNLHDFIVNGWDDAEARVPEDLMDALEQDAGKARDGDRAHARPGAEDDAFPWEEPRDADEAEGAEDTDERPPEVFDRVRVILEIFSERARSQEARLQVELARLQYEAPLVKEFIHLLRKGERPGFLAGGEHEIQQYYDMINRRMAKIRDELDKVRRERDVRRKHRRRSGFHLVSLAGYTNAGKSTMLRALSAPRVNAGRGSGGERPRRGSTPLQGADILVENRYFSTLGTKTRRAESGKREILVTDTVGFIEDLPPWIVKAFHSTLEEIALADVIALVVDANDPYPELARKIASSLSTLWEFDAQRHRVDANADTRAPTPDDEDAPPPAHAPWATPTASRARDAKDDAAPVRDAGDDAPSAGAAAARHEDAPAMAMKDDAPAASTKDEHAPARAAPSHPDDVHARQPAFAEDAARGPQSLAPIVIVLNKVDAVPRARFHENLRRLQEDGLVGENWVAVSARTAHGLDAFYEAVYALLPGYTAFTLELPPSPDTEAFLAWLYEETDVMDVQRSNVVCVSVEAKAELTDQVRDRVEAAAGRVVDSTPVT